MAKIREISPELAKIARDELGEDPARIPADLQAIKDWLAKQRHIKARTDDQWLIAFLRGCKYSLEKTKEKLDNYYSMKTMVPEIRDAVDPRDKKIQDMLNVGFCLILPKTCAPDGPRVILVRPAALDPSKYSILDSLAINNFFSELMLLEDDHTTIAGQRLIIDLKNYGMAHITKLTPTTIKKMVLCGQERLPFREKGTHHINTPTGIETVVSIMKSFMNEKSRNRIFVHNADTMESLYKFVPKEILPVEYGGNGGTIQEIIEIWREKFESHRKWFLENAQFKTDESKRPGKPKTAETLFGIEGSFRKLNID